MRRAGKVAPISALVAVLAALFACLAAASADAAPLVWTANSKTASVSTIDSGSAEVVGSPITTGTGPNSIAITPNGQRAVVVGFAGKDVTIIETATRAPIRTLSLGGNGESVAISPKGGIAYVTDEGDEDVHVFNVETASPAGSFEVGPKASAVAFSPNGEQAYVGTESGVDIVDVATEKVVKGPIEVGGVPTSIVFTPNGKTAYVTAAGAKQVAVINTALALNVETIPLTAEPSDLAVSPDGAKLYILSKVAGTLGVTGTATNKTPATSIVIGTGPAADPTEVALSPDGATAYVAAFGSEQVIPVKTATETSLAPIPMTGDGVAHLVVAPDQSPVAAFTAPSPTATFPATFSAAGSTDPDGFISTFDWSFGEGAVAEGASVSHTYGKAGTYDAKLSVVDNEGCGEAEVFTGRTAYCGGAAASVSHPVTVSAPPVVCSAKFRVTRLIHRRKNGTVKMQLKLPGAGFVLLFGKKVHAVTRKAKKAGSMWLTIHARVEVAKRLKTVHHAHVQTRITFTPNAGCGFKTVHRSFSLQRRKKKRH